MAAEGVGFSLEGIRRLIRAQQPNISEGELQAKAQLVYTVALTS